MKNNEITFISVSYNNISDTFDFCKSLYNQKFLDNIIIKCFIIDNSDNFDFIDPIKDLENTFKFVTVIRPGNNLGYFGAFNFAFDLNIINFKSSVVICNNDLVFSNDFCQNLHRSQYQKNIFVVCPDVVTLDGYHQNPHVITPLGFLGRLKLDLYFSNFYMGYLMKIIYKLFAFAKIKKRGRQHNNPMFLHMGIGACYVLTEFFFDNFSRLNYPYFLYGEEAFLSNQVHSIGGVLYYDPALIVTHKESATLSKTPQKTSYKYARDGYCEYRRFY